MRKHRFTRLSHVNPYSRSLGSTALNPQPSTPPARRLDRILTRQHLPRPRPLQRAGVVITMCRIRWHAIRVNLCNSCLPSNVPDPRATTPRGVPLGYSGERDGRAASAGSSPGAFRALQANGHELLSSYLQKVGGAGELPPPGAVSCSLLRAVLPTQHRA